MATTKSLLNTPAEFTPNTQLTIDGLQVPGRSGELLIDLLNRRTAVDAQKPVPQVCYVKQMDPIESCDTCLVKVNGEILTKTDLETRQRGVASNVEALYAALSETKWPQILSAAEAVLACVPEHPAARQARSRAWQQIAAIAPNGRAVIYPTGGHALVGRYSEALSEIESFLSENSCPTPRKGSYQD